MKDEGEKEKKNKEKRASRALYVLKSRVLGCFSSTAMPPETYEPYLERSSSSWNECGCAGGGRGRACQAGLSSRRWPVGGVFGGVARRGTAEGGEGGGRKGGGGGAAGGEAAAERLAAAVRPGRGPASGREALRWCCLGFRLISNVLY